MRVYIAGPYSNGNVGQNVAIAVRVADMCWAAGHTPFVPHLIHFWHIISPKTYEEWLEYDRIWLQQCDVLFRITGKSEGADKEEAWAKELNMPVVYSIKELCQLGDDDTAWEEAKKRKLEALDGAFGLLTDLSPEQLRQYEEATARRILIR